MEIENRIKKELKEEKESLKKEIKEVSELLNNVEYSWDYLGDLESAIGNIRSSLVWILAYNKLLEIGEDEE